MTKSYRQFYWEHAIRQIRVALGMIWNGVVLNKGHHSKWKRSKV